MCSWFCSVVRAWWSWVISALHSTDWGSFTRAGGSKMGSFRCLVLQQGRLKWLQVSWFLFLCPLILQGRCLSTWSTWHVSSISLHSDWLPGEWKQKLPLSWHLGGHWRSILSAEFSWSRQVRKLGWNPGEELDPSLMSEGCSCVWEALLVTLLIVTAQGSKHRPAWLQAPDPASLAPAHLSEYFCLASLFSSFYSFLRWTPRNRESWS